MARSTTRRRLAELQRGDLSARARVDQEQPIAGFTDHEDDADLS